MIDKAVFGGGCFWCNESMYSLLRGVSAVTSGYGGGTLSYPTEEQIHNHGSGHAEVIEISFDPSIISYRKLLEIFFTTHDPTTPNQQGNDIGPEYRSIILYNSEEQQKIAEDVLTNFAQSLWPNPIVTEIKPLDTFWPAENYHQNFFQNNPEQPYCQIIINPKLAKFRKNFAELLKD